MSDKERVIQLLDKVPDYKIGYVLAYAQGITADKLKKVIGERVSFYMNC